MLVIYFGWWWVVVGSGGYILASEGWWLVVDISVWWWGVVDGGGWWWVMAQFSLTQKLKLINKKKFLCLYRSPGQNKKDDFETILQNLELNFDHKAEKNPFMIVVLGDFNSKSKSWYTNDSTDFEGLKMDILTF